MEEAHYEAIAPYQKQSSDEIDISKGDIIKVKLPLKEEWGVVEQLNVTWIMGCNDRTKETGEFPGNYVKFLKKVSLPPEISPRPDRSSLVPKPARQTNDRTNETGEFPGNFVKSLKEEAHYEALAAYEKQSSDELDISIGDIIKVKLPLKEEWGVVEKLDVTWVKGCNDRTKETGEFQGNFVKFLKKVSLPPEISPRPDQSSLVPKPARQTNDRTNETGEFPGNFVKSLKEEAHYEALAAYEKQSSDELDISLGDIIKVKLPLKEEWGVVEKLDVTWITGSNDRTKETGEFQGNFVKFLKKVSLPPEILPRPEPRADRNSLVPKMTKISKEWLEKDEYWFLDISRTEAINKLHNRAPGTFLIRPVPNPFVDQPYALTIVTRTSGKPEHCLISRKWGLYGFDKSTCFKSLSELVLYYSHYSLGVHNPEKLNNVCLEFPVSAPVTDQIYVHA